MIANRLNFSLLNFGRKQMCTHNTKALIEQLWPCFGYTTRSVCKQKREVLRGPLNSVRNGDTVTDDAFVHSIILL